jgi:hypothetical protein
MNSETFRDISCTNRNSSSVKLSNQKAAVEAGNISATFSDAIKVAKSLNTAIKNMCPECIELIQKALPEQEQEHTTTNEHSYVMSGGLV